MINAIIAIAARAISAKLVIKLTLAALKYLVKRTDNSLDDEIVELVEKSLESEVK